MRLLFLAPAPPSDRHGGGALRMLHLVRYLGQRFEVDLVAPALDGRQEAEQLLGKVCAEMEFVPVRESSRLSRLGHLGPYQTDPAVGEAVHRRIGTRHYQAIQVEKPAMLPYLPKEHGLPIVLDLWAYGLSGPWRAVKHERGGLALNAQSYPLGSIRILRYVLLAESLFLISRFPRGQCPLWARQTAPAHRDCAKWGRLLRRHR